MRDWHSSEDGSVIAIDGKTLRGSYDKSRRRGAIHVISAFAAMVGVVLGQLKKRWEKQWNYCYSGVN